MTLFDPVFRSVKTVSRHLGFYPLTRRLHRRLVDHTDWHRFQLDLALYRQFIRPGDLCFDVGANFGRKTEVFIALGARVVAFEPQPDCCDEIAALNPAATVVRSAVGSRVGVASLRVDPHRTGSSIVADWRQNTEGAIEVQVTTLDDAMRTYGVPAFCKIDVEGFEMEVLRGMRQRPAALSFEYTTHRLGDALACLDFLRQFGDFEINITGNDDCRLISQQWIPSKNAEDFLRTALREHSDYQWGDVLLKGRG